MANFTQIGKDLFIGPQPAEQDLKEARQHGIHTVIDMRLPGETTVSNADLARNNGLDYVSVPVDKMALTEQQVNELEAAMRRTEGPYLLHCATGARAALLLALSRARQNGWTAERTFEEPQAMGFDLRNMPAFASFVTQVIAT